MENKNLIMAKEKCRVKVINDTGQFEFSCILIPIDMYTGEMLLNLRGESVPIKNILESIRTKSVSNVVISFVENEIELSAKNIILKQYNNYLLHIKMNNY